MRVEVAQRIPTDPPSALQIQLSEQLQDLDATTYYLVFACEEFGEELTLLERQQDQLQKGRKTYFQEAHTSRISGLRMED
jgi:hypothetical protein